MLLLLLIVILLLYLLDDSFNELPEVMDRTVCVNVMDQLSDDLCVGVGLELVSFSLKKKNLPFRFVTSNFVLSLKRKLIFDYN